MRSGSDRMRFPRALVGGSMETASAFSSLTLTTASVREGERLESNA